MKNQNHTSHRALHTSQNGITLISLIITIIVMLILVGATINVALSGGLFTKASEASKQMQIQAEKEELLSSVVAAIGYDGKVDLADIELPVGWTGSNGTYTSPKGNTFTVDANGKIEEGESKTEEPPTLELVQIAKGAYSDHASIGLVIKFNDFEQVYASMEEVYNSIKEEDMPDNMEDYLLEVYNGNLETNYGSIEETGMTLEEMFKLMFLGNENWENNGTYIAFMNENITFNIRRPDSTTDTFEYGGNYSSSFNGLEGVYKYKESTVSETETHGYYYSATQTGTYEISTTIAGYTLTDTITIEAF